LVDVDRQPSNETMYVELALFERGLQAIAALRERAALRVLIGGSVRRFQFNVKDDQAHEVLERHGLDDESFRRVLVDLEDVLLPAVTGVDVEHFASRRADPNRFPDGEVEERETAEAKYKLVEEVFDIQALARRVWAKSTSKNELPGRFDWEVSRRLADAELEGPDGEPALIATLRISAEPVDLTWPILPRATEITMTVDVEDVAFMIESLTRLEEALDGADNGEGAR
jgi:hypothetical protein